MKVRNIFPAITLSIMMLSTSLSANTLKLYSSVFSEGGLLPIKYSCDGDSASPPLNWSGVPENAKSLVLIMDHHPKPRNDERPEPRGKEKPELRGDEPPEPRRDEKGDREQPEESLRWYWTMYNIPSSVTEVETNNSVGTLGSNIVNDKNSYASPCSKGPGEKLYTFHLYALSETLQISDSQKVTALTLRESMQGMVLDSASISVSFEREAREGNERPSKPKSQLVTPTVQNSIDSEACSVIRKSVSDAGFLGVTVTCDKKYAYISSNTYPDHDLMNGIVGTNEQIPVPASSYAAPILLNPQMADEKTSIDAAVGVAVNGVPIYDYSAQGELDLDQYDPNQDTVITGQLDQCGGHAGRGDDYHYHAKPTCMIDNMNNVSDSTIIGWGYDGFPLYTDQNPDGSEIKSGELDVCNGQSDNEFGYRYHTSSTPPYIIQCLVGKVDTQVLPRVAPLEGGAFRPDLRPPQGGVENLTHTEDEKGTRTLSYTYQGVQYYSRYTPSKTEENCYDFEQKIVSNNGKVESGTLCR